MTIARGVLAGYMMMLNDQLTSCLSTLQSQYCSLIIDHNTLTQDFNTLLSNYSNLKSDYSVLEA